jgi:2-dehydropantoate 2-reductase
MNKVLIFGTGGVGVVYGYLLHKGGAEVTAVCRTNYEAAKAHGLHIRSKIFGNVHFGPKVVDKVSDANEQYDYIVVCSKAFPGTCKMIAAAVSPQTAIVLGQNGIGIEDEYREMYPGNTIISGVVWLPVTQVEPGKHIYT